MPTPDQQLPGSPWQPDFPSETMPDVAMAEIDAHKRINLHERVERDHAHHAPPNADIANTHARVRSLVVNTAHALIDLLPPGRELSIVLTKLDEARMWGNKAVAQDPERCGELP